MQTTGVEQTDSVCQTFYKMQDGEVQTIIKQFTEIDVQTNIKEHKHRQA